MNQKTSRLFKFFSLSAVTLTVTAIAFFSLLLASCAPIAENERMVVPYGYAKISVAVAGHQSGRAVTQDDKDAARLEIFFNGKSNVESTHGVFPVDSTVSIRVVGYRQGTDEVIGVGTATHKMNRSNNVAHVKLGPVSGSYILRFSYGEAANLPGVKAGLPSGTEFYKGGEDVTAPNPTDGKSNIEWTHGTLSGWTYTDDNGATQTVSATSPQSSPWKFQMPKKETMLTAQWTKNTYKITYYDNAPRDTSSAAQITWGGDNPTQQPQNVTALDNATVFNETPTSSQFGGKDWTFTGWLGSDGKTYQPGQSIPSVTGDFTLTAQWSDKHVWTVTYNKGNTQANEQNITNWIGSDNAVDGDSVRLPTLQAAGYTFGGWQITAGGSGSHNGGADYTPTGNVTFTAQWTVDTYMLSYNYDGGSQNVAGAASFTVEDTSVTFPTVNNKTGYTFSHWSVNGTNVTGYTGSQLINLVASGKSLALTAVWNINSYAVTTNAGNGVQASEVQNLPNLGSQNYNATVQLGTEPTRTGYTFAGWDVTPTSVQIGGSGNGRSFTMPAEAVTLTAKWTPIEYTITYNANGGGTNPANTTFTIVTTNFSLASSDRLLKQGYSFDGWEKTDGTDVSNMNTSELIAEISSGTTLALRAKWQEMSELNVKSDGSDDTGDGSATKPFATVQKALEIANMLTGTNLTIKVNGTVEVSEPIWFGGTNKTFTLMGTNNGTLKRATKDSPYTDRFVTVSSIHLTLQNITLDGNKDNGVTSEDACIHMTDSATVVTMESGTVIQNFKSTGHSGAGVCVSGKFIMNDGVIQNNENIVEGAAYGGVYIGTNGTFEMYGGSITGNKAECTEDYSRGGAGGIAVIGQNATCIIAGGSITNNEFKYTTYTRGGSYGGVYASSSLSGNIFKIGSTDTSKNKPITITGNKNTTTTATECNITLGNNVVLESQPATSSQIGVTSANGTTGVFTSGWQSSWDKSVFTSDDASKTIDVDADTGELKVQ